MAEKVVVRAIGVSPGLDGVIESTRKSLGMNRSAFFRYAVYRLLTDHPAIMRGKCGE